MELFVTIIHYIICTFLVVVILLQAGKGADIGAAFGAGGSQTLFGARGAATFLNKLTAGVAIAFLGTSLILVSMAKSESGDTVFKKIPAAALPVETQPAPSETQP